MSTSESIAGNGDKFHNDKSNKALDEEDADVGFERFDEEVPIDPLLSLLYARHTLTSPYSTSEERQVAMSAMYKEMLEYNMAPYLRMVREALELSLDESKLQEMDLINTAKVEAIDAKLKDAQENLGDTEVRDALQAKCDHYARIGDFEACLKYNEECAAKTLAVGRKLDLCFQRIRLGIAFSDNEVAAKGINDAHRLMISGDWERRNRLKVYEGVYHVMVRDFRRGSELLLDCITTFASGELISFRDFVFITVIASLPVLGRSELKKRIIDSPEVLGADLPELCDFVNAIHGCRYRDVFPALGVICQKQRRIVYVSPHVNYFFRETRVLVFTQFLDSYSSVTLQSMATTFGIPLPVLDQMLCTLIANECIACKMDRVNNSITTYRGNTTNFDYHNIIKNGDLLLNRIQKLSRLVEM